MGKIGKKFKSVMPGAKALMGQLKANSSPVESRQLAGSLCEIQPGRHS
jgi:hypothetical protein